MFIFFACIKKHDFFIYIMLRISYDIFNVYNFLFNLMEKYSIQEYWFLNK